MIVNKIILSKNLCRQYTDTPVKPGNTGINDNRKYMHALSMNVLNNHRDIIWS